MYRRIEVKRFNSKGKDGPGDRVLKTYKEGDKVNFIFKDGSTIQISFAKEKNEIKVYIPTDGKIVIKPEVSNVVQIKCLRHRVTGKEFKGDKRNPIAGS